MALIGKIRKNSWLLIFLIGLGLGGFIVMDMFSGQQSVFGSTQFTMGKVAGEKLDWNEFNRAESILYANSGGDFYARRDYLWNYFVEKKLIENEAEDLGLGVSNEELKDLEFGPNPSPIILQRFSDPTTGQVNRQILNEYRTALESGDLAKNPQFGPFWGFQQKEIIKDRLQTKLNTLVSKAMYTPSWLVEQNHIDQNTKVDISYVHIPFDEIPDIDVEVSDADYKAYLKEHRNEYIRDEENRKVEYVVFNVKPTAQDSAKLRQEMVDLIPAFRETDDDSTFVDNNYGSYDAAYVKKARLNPDVADTLLNATPGTVIGPYTEGNAYKLVKLIDRKVVPDSVQSRHILISANDPASLAQAQRRIDSLKTLIENGTHTFDSLARTNGQDATASKGGDLGFAGPNSMVKPFNDLIFYDAEVGELNTVITQFGVHLVEVTDRKYIENEEGAKVAYVTQSIVPSEATQKDEFNNVLEFVARNRTLEQLATSAEESAELELTTSPPLTKNSYTIGTLGSGNSSRDIVRWAFSSDAEVGSVSPSIYVYQDPVEFYESKYVVVGLKNIQAAGSVEVDDVKDEIAAMVKNLKKGEAIKGKISSQDLAAIAGTFNTKVDTANGVVFSAPTVPGLGMEPKVIARAHGLQANTASQPIIGNNGVYVLKVLNKQDAPAVPNIAQLRKVMSSSVQGQVASRLIEAIKGEAEIKDYRSNFY